VKNAAKKSSTACAYAASARIERRDRNSIRLDQSDSSHTHRSSDPSWADHAAAAR